MAALVKRSDGRLMNTSKQSMITATLSLNLAQRHLGKVLRSLGSGHNSNGVSQVLSKITHLRKMRETLEQWMEKQYARSCEDELSLSLISQHQLLERSQFQQRRGLLLVLQTCTVH